MYELDFSRKKSQNRLTYCVNDSDLLTGCVIIIFTADTFLRLDILTNFNQCLLDML